MTAMEAALTSARTDRASAQQLLGPLTGGCRTLDGFEQRRSYLSRPCARMATTNGHVALCDSCVAQRQSALGREDEATASREQATEIWRRLARMNPSRYLSQLERELFLTATASGTKAPSPAALARLEEAVEVCRQLFAVEPECGLRPADSEILLSKWYAESGGAEDSLKVLRSGMVTRRSVAAGKPSTFLDTLAPQLVMPARQEAALGHVGEALQTYQDACAIFARTEAPSREPELVARAQTLESEAKDHAGVGRETRPSPKRAERSSSQGWGRGDRAWLRAHAGASVVRDWCESDAVALRPAPWGRIGGPMTESVAAPRSHRCPCRRRRTSLR
ncbi:hypothetical protein [Streptomyces sp. NBC_00316]|uniref:hypothetical protein n=1 Tax=Streptomyces sp. NBC_00316 TaxID=2975710 RepID=UPI002E2AB6F5|nr:hypothetical protein [Streptomyces sp. NBC_00316]